MYRYFVGNVYGKICGSVRWIIWRLNVARAAAGVVFCVMTLIMLLSKKWRFCMRNKEWDGDVFWVAKMMKFQNNGVWERWAMDYGMLYMCVVLLSIKMDFVRGMKKKIWRSFRDMAARWLEFQNIGDERGMKKDMEIF